MPLSMPEDYSPEIDHDSLSLQRLAGRRAHQYILFLSSWRLVLVSYWTRCHNFGPRCPFLWQTHSFVSPDLPWLYSVAAPRCWCSSVRRRLTMFRTSHSARYLVANLPLYFVSFVICRSIFQKMPNGSIESSAGSSASCTVASRRD